MTKCNTCLYWEVRDNANHCKRLDLEKFALVGDCPFYKEGRGRKKDMDYLEEAKHAQERAHLCDVGQAQTQAAMSQAASMIALVERLDALVKVLEEIIATAGAFRR